MANLSNIDRKLLEEALAAQTELAGRWPISLGWKPGWIGTGVESSNPSRSWQCHGLRTVIFVHLNDEDPKTSRPRRWTLPYTAERGFGSSIDPNAPRISALFDDIVQIDA